MRYSSAHFHASIDLRSPHFLPTKTMPEAAELLNPVIRDAEGLREFIDDLADLAPKIERDISRLRRTPRDRELIADLFRALHNVKGDAAICRVDLGVTITHPIETLLSRLRNGELAFSDLLADAMLLALDRLELAIEAMNSSRPLEGLRLPELVAGLRTLSEAEAGQIDTLSMALIEAVTGFKPVHPSAVLRAPAPMTRGNVAEDLRFFRQLALQFEARSSLFRGRSSRLLRLAQDTNTAAGRPVDAQQLEAAVYMHDVGMMFLPEPLWLKVGKLSAEELEQMRTHPSLGAGLLERMIDWHEAARMVAEHHEMPDGRGYPRGLTGDEICPGAQILAIVDAFEAVTLKHSHRGASRSLLRAVAEINACDNQFAPEWIAHFNAVIRRMVET